MTKFFACMKNCVHSSSRTGFRVNAIAYSVFVMSQGTPCVVESLGKNVMQVDLGPMCTAAVTGQSYSFPIVVSVVYEHTLVVAETGQLFLAGKVSPHEASAAAMTEFPLEKPIKKVSLAP